MIIETIVCNRCGLKTPASENRKAEGNFKQCILPRPYNSLRCRDGVEERFYDVEFSQNKDYLIDLCPECIKEFAILMYSFVEKENK